jgi:hypothetical protein
VRTTLSRQSLESRAAKILDALSGYTRRQEWQIKDRAFLADLLQEWDNQVTDLLNERDLLRLKVDVMTEVNRRKAWRVPSGFGHYFKFLIGIAECPSR